MKTTIFAVLTALILSACAQQPHNPVAIASDDHQQILADDEKKSPEVAIDTEQVNIPHATADIDQVKTPSLRHEWKPVAIKVKIRPPSSAVARHPTSGRVIAKSTKGKAVAKSTKGKVVAKSTSSRALAGSGLWGRVGQQLKFAELEHPRITEHVEKISRNPKYVKRLSRHAQPFLYYIVTEINKRRLPAEVVLVPIVESSFQPTALSPAQAAGLWQIIPNTGDHFGLKRNDWYDARYDLRASTRVALDYLQYLHKIFKGDWLLALAAYNCGEGTVLKAIKKNEDQGKPTDFWDLGLPASTMEYVPRILAFSKIVADPKGHGVSLHKIANKPYLTKVRIDSKVDFSEMLAAAGDDFYHFNAAFKPDITPPSATYEVLLPPKQALALRNKLGNTVAITPLQKGPAQRHHRVKRGDTLSTIAKRYGVSYRKLARWNGISETSILRPGQKLVIRAVPMRT